MITRLLFSTAQNKNLFLEFWQDAKTKFPFSAFSKNCRTWTIHHPSTLDSIEKMMWNHLNVGKFEVFWWLENHRAITYTRVACINESFVSKNSFHYLMLVTWLVANTFSRKHQCNRSNMNNGHFSVFFFQITVIFGWKWRSPQSI